MKTGKKIVSLLLAMIMIVTSTITGFAADPAQEQPAYTITVQSDFGQVLLNDQKPTDMQYQAGTEISIKVLPDQGYLTDTVSLNGDPIALKENQAMFKMPQQDSVLKVSYTKQEEPKQEEKTEEVKVPDTPEKTTPESTVSKKEETKDTKTPEEKKDTVKPEKKKEIKKIDKQKEKEKAERLQLAKEKGLIEYLDSDGFLVDSYFEGKSDLELTLSGVVPLIRNVFTDPKLTRAVSSYEKVTYMNISTAKFAVDGKLAFCLEYAKATPAAGTATGTPVEITDINVKAAMYFGYKGPKAYAFTSDSQAVLLTASLSSYYYSGQTPFSSPTSPNAQKTGYTAFYNYVQQHKNEVPSGFKAYAVDTGGSTQDLGYWIYTPEVKGSAKLKKASANPEITNGNGCYSLAGATYGIYSNMGCTTQVGTFTTNANGESNTITLNAATYYVKETKAPTGYALDTKVYPVTVTANKTATVSVQDTPLEDPAVVEIQKVDADTGEEVQGSASLAGAEFTFKYYAGYYTKETLPANATRTWVMQTKEIINSSGKAVYMTRLSDEYKVSGDEFYRAPSGRATLPLGTITVEETKAPEGYLLDGAYLKPDGSDEKITGMYVAQIKQDGNLAKLSGGNKYSMNDKVVRGDLEIIKLAENEDLDDDTLHGLQGAEFTITSKTNGKQWVIVSDENGVATTVSEENPDGTLPFDTYTVTETKTPEGYETIKPFDVTIKDEGVLLRGIYKEDKLITTPISVVKVDASTGKTIPLANTEFQILDSNKQVITMTTHYPNTVVHETFKTDENGQLTFPEKLKYGTYYLREVNAPNGYLLNGEELQFTVTERGEWENPQVVRFSDQPAMGKIRVMKTDKTTDKVIPSGAEFTITAAEDITTPDGTVRAEKGEIVDTLVTDATGRAESTELFLGKYIVKETKAPNGYVLNKKEFKVTLKYADQNTAVVYKDVTVKDQPVMGKINVSKVDATTGKPISVAATFEIRAAEDIITPDGTIRAKAGELVDTVITKKDGTAQSKKLHLGAYTVQEVVAPEGYLISDEIHHIVLSYADQNTPIVFESVTAENAPAMGRIQIQKADVETKEPLAGAVFEITAKEDITTLDGTLRAKAGELVDTISSGEDGIAESKELFLGTYTITETKQPAGYLLPKDSWEVTLSYKDQVTPIVIETLEVENQPTVVIIDKKVTGSEERLSGVKFAVWNKAMGEDDVDPGMGVKETFTTARNGQIRITNLLPGTYCVQEVEGIPGYGMDTEIHEFTINEDGRIDGEDEIIITVENAKSDIHTTAKDQATGTNQAIARENTTIIDTIEYKNLKPGKEYTIKGILMNKATGEELLVSGNTVSAEKTFTPETKDGTVDLEFTFDSRALKGNAVVAFESLYEDEIEVATHADLSDEGQTIEFPKHEIHTTARDQDSGNNIAQAKKETTIIDTVEYKNLIVGQEYTMKGILMDQSTGEALLVNGKTVTAETTFVAEQPNGSIEMKFTFDSSALQGKAVVVFENLYQDGTLVATHADLSDKGQTVTFQKEVPPVEEETGVKTGDATAPYMLAGIMMMSVAVALMIYLKKKDKKETK